MDASIDRTITAFANFSVALGIKPPLTNDVLKWWEESLNVISNENLLDLVEFGFLADSKRTNLKKMHQLMMQQIEKRQLLNALA